MSTSQNQQRESMRDSEQREINEADVTAYLRNHPDFFRSQPALLGELSLPHVTGNAASLVEKQVAVLRERGIKARRKLGELIENAKDNDSLFEKTQQLVLKILQASNSDQLFQLVESAFSNDFDVELCAIVVLSSNTDKADEGATQNKALFTGKRVKSLTDNDNAVANIIKNNKTFCGALRTAEEQFIFSRELSANNAISAAVTIRDLDTNDQSKTYKLLIAVGHKDGNHYGSDTGTIFIDYIADILQIQLNRIIASRHANN